MYKEEILYSDDMFTAINEGFGLSMYWTKSLQPGSHRECCGHIVNGMRGFEKIYKSDFQKWISAIRKRELRTMRSYRYQAETLMKSARHMQEMNNFTEDQFNG